MQPDVVDLRYFKLKSINSVISNSVSLKYQRSTPSGDTEIGIRQIEFAVKTQFLSFV